MNKNSLTFRFLFPLSLAAGMILTACGSSGSGKNVETDSTVETKAPKSSTKGEFLSVSFNDENDVREFMHFKKFTHGESVIGFNRTGGYMDGEKFDITSIKVVSSKEADISIAIPSVDISGTFRVKIDKDSLMLKDTHADITYKLAQ
ncbi:MAG: hypothetical protein K2N05_10710 [Muribaculaceae bacterium]|nr:hypothetical protein [Muribaculaceae bacterium]